MKQFRLGQLALVTALVILGYRFIALPGTAAAQNVNALNFGWPSHGGPKAVDPGPRSGAPGAGGPLAGVGIGNQQFFGRGSGVVGYFAAEPIARVPFLVRLRRERQSSITGRRVNRQLTAIGFRGTGERTDLLCSLP